MASPKEYQIKCNIDAAAYVYLVPTVCGGILEITIILDVELFGVVFASETTNKNE